MVIKVYISTVSSSRETKKYQQKIDMILTSKNINFEAIDVAASDEAKAKMRELMGDPKGLPPQIFNEDVYCGDFEAFENALEEETLSKFLKL